MAKRKDEKRSLATIVSGVPFTAYCDKCRGTLAADKLPAFCSHCGAKLWTVNDLQAHKSFHPYTGIIPESYREFYAETFAKASANSTLKESR